MSAQDLKLSIGQLLTTTEDPEILALVYALLKKFSLFEADGIAGYEADGTPITDEDLVESIVASSREVRAGQIISHAEMKNLLGLQHV